MLISHKLKEVESVADTITVLRDGAVIESLDAKDGAVTEDRIIRGMVGRDMTHRFPPREAEIGDVHFEVKNWKVRHPLYEDRMVINDVSINVRKGEVVGIAGLMGAGRTEFAMSLFGRSWGAFESGQVLKDGVEIDVSTIPRAIKNGLAYVDRGPQDVRARADERRQDEHHDGEPRRRVEPAASSSRPRRSRSRTSTATRSRSRRPASSRSPTTCRAATSRRSSSRSGCSPTRTC